MSLIELERDAAAARKEWEAVAYMRYSLDIEEAKLELQARAKMTQAATAYRRAYRAWEREKHEEAARYDQKLVLAALAEWHGSREWGTENANEQRIERL